MKQNNKAKPTLSLSLSLFLCGIEVSADSGTTYNERRSSTDDNCCLQCVGTSEPNQRSPLSQNRRWSYLRNRVRPLNPMDDGTCRTLKAQYFKTGRINFQYKNDWGVTGVMVIYETN